MDMKNVDAPSHYMQGKIEVVDFILDQKLSYCEGNVVKYICRYKHKGKPKEDLLKARKYIDFLLRQFDEAERKPDDDIRNYILAGYTQLDPSGRYYIKDEKGRS